VLVHGEFTGTNVLVSAPRVGRRLSVMHWDIAGWGVPAPDVAAADLGCYRRTIGASWGQISSTTWQALAAIGTVLRLILRIEAESRDLSGSRVEKPVRRLELYRSGLAGAIGELSK
jgi:hypothetical protein